MKKSAILLAYYFPPEASAGTFRPLRFVRHLSNAGWCTSVVSADPYCYERYDPDLLALVPRETSIIRVRGRDPWQGTQAWRGQRIQKKILDAPSEIREEILASQYKPMRSRIREIVNKAEAYYYRPDMARPWIQPAITATVDICARRRPDVIWATAGPVSAWLVAHQASRRTGVPYVLDLRDPHGLGYYDWELLWPTWIRRKVRRTIHQVLKGAQAVVFLFESVAECFYRVFPGALDPSKIHIIPNGYDGTINEFTVAGAKRCTILYTGTMASYRYDTLLESLALLMTANPKIAEQLQFRFVGEGMDDLFNKVAALGLREIVEIMRPVTQAQIAGLQNEAHALLVLGRPASVKGHELVAGAKLFEYLKAARPIVGILPQDETRKILQTVGVSTIADVDSPAEILSVLQSVLNARSTGRLADLLPDRSACEIYSADRQIRDLTRALESVPAVKPFIPGSVTIPPSLRAEIGA